MTRGNNPAIFLDRDGVIIADKHFQINPDDIEFIFGSLDALKRVPLGYVIVSISNQSGVARGLFCERDVIVFNDALDSRLRSFGINIAGWYFCPHGPDDNCPCRKPAPGMIFQAADDLSIDLDRSWLIGDKSSDISAGNKAGVTTILVRTGYAGIEEEKVDVRPDFVADNLYGAIEIVIRGKQT